MFSPCSCYIRAKPQTSHWTRYTLHYVGGTQRHPGCVFEGFFNHISCHVQVSLTQYDTQMMLCLFSGKIFLSFSAFNQIKLYTSSLTVNAYANVHFNSPILLKWANNILLVVFEHMHRFLICQCKIRHFGRAKSIVVWKRVGYGGACVFPTEGEVQLSAFIPVFMRNAPSLILFPQPANQRTVRYGVAYTVCSQRIGWTWRGMLYFHNRLAVSRCCFFQKLYKYSMQKAAYMLLQLIYRCCIFSS